MAEKKPDVHFKIIKVNDTTSRIEYVQFIHRFLFDDGTTQDLIAPHRITSTELGEVLVHWKKEKIEGSAILATTDQ